MKTQDGSLIAVSGASRSGKTAWTVKQIRRRRRVLVWDPEDQWSALPGFKRITNRRDLLAAVQTKGAGKLAYVAGGDLGAEFNFWAGCAFHWRRWHGPADAVAEEMADVSSPGKAPGEWGKLIRRGLKRGGDIFAISQRWAEADKTTLGNATRIVIFRSIGDDAAYLARKVSIKQAAIAGMRPLQFVDYDTTTGDLRRGELRF